MLFRAKAFYVLLDILAITSAFLFTCLARFATWNGANLAFGQEYGWILLVSLYFLVILFYRREEQLSRRNAWKEARVVVQINFFMALLLAVCLYLSKSSEQFPRSFYILFFGFDCLFMYLFRMYYKVLLFGYYGKKKNKRQLLVFANESNVLKVLHKLQNSKLHEYDIIGVTIIKGNEKAESKEIEINKVLRRETGSYMVVAEEKIEEFLVKNVIDEALLSLPECGSEYLNGLVKRLENLGIAVHLTINTFGIQNREKALEDFGCYHVLTYSPRIFEPTELFLKRAMDIAGGLVGAALTVVIGLVLVPAIKLESPGPAVFKQTRIGRNGRRFSIYKFRSMYIDAEERKKELMAKNEMSGLMFKMKDDPRITKVGKFIRKTSLDEFPQFFNVLRGDMSLVGTRPPTEDEFVQYEERHKRRLSLKPGITGMWQVSGRSDIQDFDEVVNLDLEYIDNWSIWMDIRILLQTVWVVLGNKGAH